MTVTVYKSTDSGAPILNGTTGTIITLLDSCLVNGYGSKAGAGWTKEHTGTNLAAYRMTTTSPATGFYLRVDDTNATITRVVGYESMSSINTGTNAFPTNSQVVGGMYVTKSSAAGATPRPWALIADDRAFYLIVGTAQTTFGATSSNDFFMFFGDLITNKPASDGYQCAIIAHEGSATGTQYFGQVTTTASFANRVGHYLARSYTGMGSSIGFAKLRRAPFLSASTTILGSAIASAYPDPVTGFLNLWKIEVMEGTDLFRGFMPGLYEPYGGSNVGNYYDTVNGTGTLNGLEFTLVPCYSTTSVGMAAIQSSGSWY